MAPPPPQQQQQPQPVGRSQHSWLMRCIALTALGLIILTILVVIIIWVSVQPRRLKYSMEHGSISAYNLTNDVLNANFHFVLRANNPNKRISLYYDRIDVSVLYEDQILSVGGFAPFYQPRRNVTHLGLHLAAKNEKVYGAVARDLKVDRASGDVDLDVKIRAKIRWKIGVFKIHRKLKVLCESLRVPFTSSKGFQRVQCDVDVD
ncbi:NDR1/HIN1-like protein 10 [Primulina huaijiensis]|uniref:NDR1/HIN1-like protein 10 n=1 Tax=Primulina huaijiensis TaxID=1492673 RepID=UPI003CC764FB